MEACCVTHFMYAFSTAMNSLDMFEAAQEFALSSNETNKSSFKNIVEERQGERERESKRNMRFEVILVGKVKRVCSEKFKNKK